MKANLVKELHSMGVYRDPKTKQKLECMKVSDILQVMKFVEEEKANGVVFEKNEWEYEMVSPNYFRREKGLAKKKK